MAKSEWSRTREPLIKNVGIYLKELPGKWNERVSLFNGSFSEFRFKEISVPIFQSVNVKELKKKN